MNNLNDLNIAYEILPLFDYSFNRHTRNRILQLLHTPLSSISDIITRQKTLKGFIANYHILEHYDYAEIYFNELYGFVTDPLFEDLSQQKAWFRFLSLSNPDDKRRLISKYNQLILFLYEVEGFINQLNLNEFPEAYRLELRLMTAFLGQLELPVIEPFARFSKWKDSQIIALSKQLFTLKQDKQLDEFWDKLFEFEAFLSISIGIREQGFNFPTFQNQGISLHGFYHPLLTHPVKNNFKTEKTVVLLNGPNMSGKSTMLKAIGICIYLGHTGVGIPAGKAVLPFMHRFSVAINRNDDLQKGYSHFMTELNNLKQVVNQAVAGYHCFAVFDELFSGTNEEDAFEILKTTVHGLGRFNNCLVFISTHIQKFKEVEHPWLANYHVECTVEKGQPQFTYRIKEGWSDIKVGKILFNREGLNEILGYHEGKKKT